MQELELGVLGVGGIGKVHLQSAQHVDGVSVVAAADAVERNRRHAARLGVDRTYDDYTRLLGAESLDAVVVALPPFLHADATIAAANAGCHAFVEKPFARTVEEADTMIAAADRHGVAVGVDHTVRYQPDIRRMKDRYDEGSLGHVPQCSLVRVNTGPFAGPPDPGATPDWQLDPHATGGGALMDLGVHLFDVLSWFFGELSVAYARTDNQLNTPFEDTATVVLTAASDTVAVLRCGFYQWETPPDINMYFRLDGVTETVENTEFTPDNFTAYAGKTAVENLKRRLGGDDPEYFKPTFYYRAHFLALRDFLTSVRDGEAPPVGAGQGRRTVELVEEAYRRAGEETPVPEVADD